MIKIFPVTLLKLNLCIMELTYMWFQKINIISNVSHKRKKRKVIVLNFHIINIKLHEQHCSY